MRSRNVGFLFLCACGVLARVETVRAQNPPIEIELACTVRRGPGVDSGVSSDERLRVEIQSPAGEILREAPARAGHASTFKRLRPGIVVACVKNAWEGSRCQSVDLYPPPGSRKARFSVEFEPPSWSPGSAQFRLVDASHLTVPDKARRELENCLRERRLGHSPKATEHLERALRIHPDYPEALSNLGTLYHQAGNYGRALEMFERVTRITPGLHFGWYNLGATLLESGRVREAMQASIRALSLRPDDPLVLYQVGFCHYKLGELEEARMHLERVIELDPVSATYPHLCLATIALREGKREEAEQLVRQVTLLHPHSPHPPAMQTLLKRLAAQGE